MRFSAEGLAGRSTFYGPAVSRAQRRAGEIDPGVRRAGGARGPGWRGLLRVVLVAVLLAVGGCGFLVAYAAFTLPSIDSLGAVTGSLRILDSHGALIADVSLSSTPHDSVSLDQVAPVMQQAIIAAEDRQFPTEGAINPGRILKALVVDLVLGRPAEGASTITQQLARNVFLSPEQSPMRKLREVLLADEIDQRYSKQQILEMYLNTIYFGHGAYGIEDDLDDAIRSKETAGRPRDLPVIPLLYRHRDPARHGAASGTDGRLTGLGVR